MRVLTAVLVALLLVPPAVAHNPPPGPPPLDFRNGHSSSFGAAAMTPYLAFRGEPVPVEATFRLDAPEVVAAAAFVLFAFNLHSARAGVELTALEAANGTAVPWARDERGANPLQPRVLVAAADLAGVREVILRGEASASGAGQFHVGAMVIAFGQEWETLGTAAGDRAELYAFALLGAWGPDGSPGAPPFTGQGNVRAAGLLLLGGLAVAAAGMALGARRR